MLKELRKGNKVCLLNKSLYDLRQADRKWHAKLDAELKALGTIPTNVILVCTKPAGKMT